MAFFKIRYLKNSKENLEIIEADTFVNATKKFKAQKKGVFIGIEETDEPFELKLKNFVKNLEDKFSSKKINLEEYIGVLQQIHVMLDAGLPLVHTFTSVTKNIKDKKLKQIFLELNTDIQSGYNISDSLKKHEESIGNLSISMIELGEQTGTLAEAIKDLSDVLYEILENRNRLKKATRYPIFIIFAMAIAFTIVILFVIPPFKSLFAQLGTNLPIATRFLLWLEYFLRHYAIFVVVISIASVVVINIAYGKSYKVRLILDKLLLKVYIVGDVMYLAMIGRFIFVFDKLVAAGLPITDALDTALNIVENSYIKQELSKIKGAVEDGRGLAEGFVSSNMFEPLTYDMISAGEESGALNKMLDKVSSSYRRKYVDIVENISALIEPILIAAIAGFVATLAMGIFLPMWSIGEAMTKK